MSGERIELGHGVYAYWVGWHPDRELNPQLAHLPDNDRSLLIVGHVHPDGKVCEGGVPVDAPENRRPGHERPTWTLVSVEPLELAPSIHNPSCGLHGHIKQGRWVPA